MKPFNIFIGYDSTNRVPAYVLAESIMTNSSIPISITYLNKNNLKEFTRERSPKDSTEFSNSRFLVPYYSDYRGWSLFLDNDMIVEGDIKELLDLTQLPENQDKAVLVVKHNQIVNAERKFLGEKQTAYNKKNWSSVMLFNNEKCSVLSPDYINTANGIEMHQFKWLGDDSIIGDIPADWNYLVDVESEPQDWVKEPKLIHYTLGGAYFPETRHCPYAENWFKYYNQMNDLRVKL